MTYKIKDIISTLMNIENYPFDLDTDLKYMDTLTERYPQLDLDDVIKDYATYKLDHPLKPSDNPRSQINTACKKSVEWGKNLKKQNGSQSIYKDLSNYEP